MKEFDDDAAMRAEAISTPGGQGRTILAVGAEAGDGA
jgi:hypothetical protein